MLMELLFRQKAGRSQCLFLLTADEFGKMFIARITLAHAFKKKTNTNVTEQLTSNNVLAHIFLVLWTLNPGTASSCSAV